MCWYFLYIFPGGDFSIIFLENQKIIVINQSPFCLDEIAITFWWNKSGYCTCDRGLVLTVLCLWQENLKVISINGKVWTKQVFLGTVYWILKKNRKPLKDCLKDNDFSGINARVRSQKTRWWRWDAILAVKHLIFSENVSVVNFPNRLRCRKCEFLNLRNWVKLFVPYKRFSMKRKNRFIYLSKLFTSWMSFLL